MNIYIEGPDCSGKSYLVDLFNKKIDGSEVIKCSPGAHASSSFYDKNLFNSYIDKKDKFYIYDRFFISELVYSDLYGRENNITFDDAIDLFSKISHTDDVFIVLYESDPTTPILKERIKEKNELEYLDEIEEQNKKFTMYSYVFNTFNEYKTYYIIDISKFSKEKANNFVEEVLK